MPRRRRSPDSDDFENTLDYWSAGADDECAAYYERMEADFGRRKATFAETLPKQRVS